MKRTALLFFLYLLSQHLAAQKIVLCDSASFSMSQGVMLSKTSFRGISVPDDNTIWVSGSRGTIALSTNGGKTFSFTQLKGYEKSDFRDIEAFDNKRAVIMSSGTPAYILRTEDGGLCWKEVYKNTDTAYFLDAMDFCNDKNGMIVGDPVNGHFILLETKDGGNTWKERDSGSSPAAMEGEAVFAASGTSFRWLSKKEFGFVTGGTVSRFIRIKGKRTFVSAIPVMQGSSGQGCFSFDAYAGDILFAGGDYTADTLTGNNFAYSYSGEENIRSEAGHTGYVSCIAMIPGNSATHKQYAVITTSTHSTQVLHMRCSFTDCSWHKSPEVIREPFHTIGRSKKGKAVFLAGSKGRIAQFKY